MNNLSQVQIDTNRANALNVRSAFLNTVTPLILEVLKNGVKRKNDNSLFEKFKKQIDEILVTNKSSDRIRACLETSQHSQRLGIKCDINYVVHGDNFGSYSVNYSKIHVELLGYEGLVLEFEPLNVLHDAKMYSEARENLKNTNKIIQENEDKARAFKRILED